MYANKGICHQKALQLLEVIQAGPWEFKETERLLILWCFQLKW